ncbi:hypothetical protein [Pandoraea aquatica]|uniref:hypothetical protein n=1 Tax=Pandoraea aquatica TaxID=2508290 RepID=UPI00123F3123|nr:hypothetical protein [Pandoraea aquatica]
MPSQENDGRNPKSDVFEFCHQFAVLGDATDVCEIFAAIHRCLWKFLAIDVAIASPMGELRELHISNRRMSSDATTTLARPKKNGPMLSHGAALF